jgi:hypothetical protein
MCKGSADSEFAFFCPSLYAINECIQMAQVRSHKMLPSHIHLTDHLNILPNTFVINCVRYLFDIFMGSFLLKTRWVLDVLYMYSVVLWHCALVVRFLP